MSNDELPKVPIIILISFVRLIQSGLYTQDIHLQIQANLFPEQYMSCNITIRIMGNVSYIVEFPASIKGLCKSL